MAETAEERPVYEIPGEQVRTLEDFYRLIGEAINGPPGYFGLNLDAFRDCLSGGFGTPEEGGYIIRRLRSEESREALGYPETIRQLEIRLARCHPLNRELVAQQLAQARRRQGPTVFDWLVEIIREFEEVELQLL